MHIASVALSSRSSHGLVTCAMPQHWLLRMWLADERRCCCAYSPAAGPTELHQPGYTLRSAALAAALQYFLAHAWGVLTVQQVGGAPGLGIRSCSSVCACACAGALSSCWGVVRRKLGAFPHLCCRAWAWWWRCSWRTAWLPTSRERQQRGGSALGQRARR